MTFSSAILTFFYKSTIFFARFSLLLLWSNSWTVVSAQLSEYTTDAMFNIQFSYDAMRLFLLKIRLAAEIFSDSEVVQCRQPSSRKVDVTEWSKVVQIYFPQWHWWWHLWYDKKARKHDAQNSGKVIKEVPILVVREPPQIQCCGCRVQTYQVLVKVSLWLAVSDTSHRLIVVELVTQLAEVARHRDHMLHTYVRTSSTPSLSLCSRYSWLFTSHNDSIGGYMFTLCYSG